MSFLDKLEKRLGFLAFPNLTLYLIIGQVAMFILLYLGPNGAAVFDAIYFSWSRVMSGEVWRIFSFMFIPPPTAWFWIIFAWMVFYLMGSTLEAHWGAFRYNLYIMTGALGAMVAGVFFPYTPVMNYYVAYSVTFGFAYLNPNFELRIYFLLPVKMKWIALFILFLLVREVAFGPISDKFVIIGSLINFPIFFGADIIRGFRSRKRVREMKEAKRQFEAEAFHECVKCGATDKSHPDRDFRYREDGAICSDCLEKEQSANGSGK